MWVIENERMVRKKIHYCPGFFNIYDEIIVNASDNFQRDETQDTIKVEINSETLEISVYNNGAGIPVEMHKKEKVYVPDLIFGHLLTGSNYNDNEKKVTGGRNGFGAKLTNIFSEKFTIETADGANIYKRTWTENMSKAGKESIRASGKNFTQVTFHPDLHRFGMTGFDEDAMGLLRKRVYDLAGCNPGKKIYLNGKRLPIKSFKDYVELFFPKPPAKDEVLSLVDLEESTFDPRKSVAYCRSGERWEIAVCPTQNGSFEQVSFVNSISTTRGGTHVNFVVDKLVKLVLDSITQKNKKSLTIKPAQVKNQLWVFIRALIENPSFDSQTKEALTLKPANFGSKPEFDEKFVKKIKSLKITDLVVDEAAKRSDESLKRKGGKSRGRLTGIPKLEDANWAGTKNSQLCTLILTEGDSAKSLAMAGIGEVGRNQFGVFPLRGKVLNVREASSKQVGENQEIMRVCKILGLQFGKEYADTKSLRYGHLMIMSDQDYDGSHIKGLVINLFHKFWPSLIHVPGFMLEFITPIVKATRGKEVISFFTMPQYEEWRDANMNKGWHIKYYKGLGTSTDLEGKEYFNNIDDHRIPFSYVDKEDDEAILLAFSKGTASANARKEWMHRTDPNVFLDHNTDAVRYSDFVNKELVLYSFDDCARSIPSMVDGLKPSQRKVLFACFKIKLRKQMKVSELTGRVSSESAYHHGDASMSETIINMAQNFTGSQNINTLMPIGQFGTRAEGGKDHAAARYINTMLSQITRFLFHVDDDCLLDYIVEEGKSIEPRWYVPVLPMVLINGADGIGMGWSTTIPCYNPEDVCKNLLLMLDGKEPEPMHPWYRGWEGELIDEGSGKYKTRGCFEWKSENTLAITELPLKKWTSDFKEGLDAMLEGDLVKDFREFHKDGRIHFEVDLSRHLSDDEVLSIFKLEKKMSITNMTCFDENGKIVQYKTAEDILRAFFRLRMNFYMKRKQSLIDKAQKELTVVSNKARFIKCVLDGDIVVNRKKKAELYRILREMKFDERTADTKVRSKHDLDVVDDDANDGMDSDDDERRRRDAEPSDGLGTGFDYLLKMPIYSLTAEKAEKLMKELDDLNALIVQLSSKPVDAFYREDIAKFLEEHKKWLEFEDSNLKGIGSKKSKKVIKNVGSDKQRKRRSLIVGDAAPKPRRKRAAAGDEDADSYSDNDEDFFKPKRAQRTRVKKEGEPAEAPKPKPRSGGGGAGTARAKASTSTSTPPSAAPAVVKKEPEPEPEFRPAIEKLPEEMTLEERLRLRALRMKSEAQKRKPEANAGTPPQESAAAKKPKLEPAALAPAGAAEDGEGDTAQTAPETEKAKPAARVKREVAKARARSRRKVDSSEESFGDATSEDESESESESEKDVEVVKRPTRVMRSHKAVKYNDDSDDFEPDEDE